MFLVYYGARRPGRQRDRAGRGPRLHQRRLPGHRPRRRLRRPRRSPQAARRAVPPSSEQFVVYRVLDALTDTFFPLLEDLEDRLEARRGDLRPPLARPPAAADRAAPRPGPARPGGDAAARHARPPHRRHPRNPGLRGRLAQLLPRRLRPRDPHLRPDRLLPRPAVGSRDAYLSVTSNRLNEITKQLTVVATIFLPLSFVVGFFGQNFGWMVDQHRLEPRLLGDRRRQHGALRRSSCCSGSGAAPTPESGGAADLLLARPRLAPHDPSPTTAAPAGPPTIRARAGRSGAGPRAWCRSKRRERGDRHVADQRRPDEAPERHPRGPGRVAGEAEGDDRDRRTASRAARRRARSSPRSARSARPRRAVEHGAGDPRADAVAEQGRGHPADGDERQRREEPVGEAGGRVDDLGRVDDDGVDQGEGDDQQRPADAEARRSGGGPRRCPPRSPRCGVAQGRDRRDQAGQDEQPGDGEGDLQPAGLAALRPAPAQILRRVPATCGLIAPLSARRPAAALARPTSLQRAPAAGPVIARPALAAAERVAAADLFRQERADVVVAVGDVAEDRARGPCARRRARRAAG